MVAATHEGQNGDTAVAPPPARSPYIASRGIRTTREASRIISAAIADSLNDSLPDRKALIAVRGVDSLIRITRTEHSLAGGGPVTLVHDEPVVAQRREQLLKELAALEAV